METDRERRLFKARKSYRFSNPRYATVERWLRQPSLSREEISSRHDAVEALRDDTEGRDRLRLALGGGGSGRGAKVPDVARLAAKLRKNTATLLDLHKLHVLAASVLPEASDAVAALDAAAFGKELAPALAKCGRDLRVYAAMADATLDLEFLPDVYLKASVDADLVAHARAMRAADDSVKDAHEAANDAFADSDLPGVKAFHAGGERSKWPLKLDKDAVRGRVLRSPRRYDEKALAGVTSRAVGRAGMEKLEILSYLKNGVYFTTPSLDRACGALARAKKDYQRNQAALTVELVKTAATYAPVFARVADLLARLDALQSFARAAAFAPGGEYVRPKITVDGPMRCVSARHPCVESIAGCQFIANDYALDDKTGRLLIVTGPNMGGKSTYIRGLAAICVMAQAGSLVPCESATLPLVDTVLARVGAGDSLHRGVSTFMAEMLEASTILDLATPRSLVVIDELGRGTSTYDGFGLAWAIAEHILLEKKCKCLFATHFHELTALDKAHAGVQNRHVTAHVDGGAITFLYEVADGPCRESYGIKVAELAGFPAKTIEVALAKAAALEGPRAKRARIAA